MSESAEKLPRLPEAHYWELRRMVESWIDEGLTTPPYTDPQYDIFEWLGVESRQYDIKRPPRD